MVKGLGAKKVLKKVRKDLKLKKSGGKSRALTRGNATVVLAQGAVAAPKRNFGTTKSKPHNIKDLLVCMDARIPRTLGLPRAVGPYTVLRTTKLHSTNAAMVMFGPWLTSANNWRDWCGVESVDPAQDITATDNTKSINMPMDGLLAGCEVVPAALTVQVMNPAALQTADGIFAMARVNQQMSLGGTGGYHWRELASRVISFYSPRMLTGGKLALKGVKCNAYPLDMTQYSEFRPVRQYNGEFTWDSDGGPAALSPIVFVQENETPVNMQFMITIEWRVRFDPGNPATASHTYHETLSDSLWNGLVKAASAAGHGVEELAEDTAMLGAAARVGASVGIL